MLYFWHDRSKCPYPNPDKPELTIEYLFNHEIHELIEDWRLKTEDLWMSLRSVFFMFFLIHNDRAKRYNTSAIQNLKPKIFLQGFQQNNNEIKLRKRVRPNFITPDRAFRPESFPVFYSPLFHHWKSSPLGLRMQTLRLREPGQRQLAMPWKGPKRIQNSGDRIQNKVIAFGSAGKYKLCRREATSFYSDSLYETTFI